MILVTHLLMYRVDEQNIAMGQNDLEDTEWLSVRKLKKMDEFKVYDFKSADKKADGIVIGAEKKGRDVEIITTRQLHALIVGTTGSGKTTGFVDQNISVLGKSSDKPNLVISDPKKELYEKHALNLEQEGYKISVLDLREPYVIKNLIIGIIIIFVIAMGHLFWCRGYYVDSVGRTKTAIAKYIQNQIEEDKLAERLSMQEHIDPFMGESKRKLKKPPKGWRLGKRCECQSY